jgi:hypothetical protein
MKDKTRKYAKMFSKAMKKFGRSDYKRLEQTAMSEIQNWCWIL